MGNTFSGYPLVDPRCIIEHRERLRRDIPQELRYANSYYSVSGECADVGWILLDRTSYNNLNKYATTHYLTIQDYLNPEITITNLSIVQAQCVTRGIASDPNAIYLVKITNMDGVLSNRWFDYPLNAQYNVIAPAYQNKFQDHTMNSGAPWTWSTMLADLWGKAPLHLGSFPGLPITPYGVPENFIFCGVPLWSTINKILTHLGLVVAGKYPNLSIVVPGNADASFSALQSSYTKYLEDDAEYIDIGSGRVPKEVTVYFHRRNQFYGSEETVRYDSNNWQSTPAYSVTVPAPAPFTELQNASGSAFLWDSFTVRYDQNSLPIAADVITANTIALERAGQFYTIIYNGIYGTMRQVYAGALPFNTGSLVDGVRHYNMGDDSGWRTEIIRGYVWPEVKDQMGE